MRAWLAGVGVTAVAVWLRGRRGRELARRRAQVLAFETQAHGPYTLADIEAMKWDD